LEQPIVVEVTRGALVESRHRVHAAAVRDGDLVAAAGEPQLVTFFRSAAKPLQALPLVRARADLRDEEVAIACASHLARPEQLAAVRSLLARAEASEDDLECGPAPTRIEHNCSGKHAGMLLLCRARGWPLAGYRLPGHPCQAAMLAEVAAAAERQPDELQTGVDGCGVVTFAATLERMAHAFSRLRELDGGERVTAAMRAHPDVVRDPSSPDTMLMRALPGWVAKGGAEGVFCACSPDGLGLALKVEDGNWRALESGVAAFLGRLGIDADLAAAVPVTNSRGDTVGETRGR
jgi:L-asparaginase II